MHRMMGPGLPIDAADYSWVHEDVLDAPSYYYDAERLDEINWMNDLKGELRVWFSVSVIM